MAASTSLSPAQITQRARKAAAARHSLDSYIRSIEARQSELTDDQATKLRAILDQAVAA